MSKQNSESTIKISKRDQLHKVSVIIPAFNEAACIGYVLEEIFSLKDENNQSPFYEVIVVDNRSTDKTAQIAHQSGAIVIYEDRQGYGQACWTGAELSNGDVLLFVDGDGSANIKESIKLIKAITLGAELSIGTRDYPEEGSMSLTQRFGNNFACSLIRTLWRVKVTDLGPFRAITRELFYQLNMEDRSFGWTVEMQVKAAQNNAQIKNIPVSWLQRKAGKSKISGTISGVFFAGTGILKMILNLWWKERKNMRNHHQMTTPVVNFTPQKTSIQSRNRCHINHSKEIKL